MAGITQTHITTIQNNSGAVAATASAALSAEAEEAFSVAVGAASSEDLVVALTVADIVAFYVTSDKAINLKTNDDGTPDQTIAIAAGAVLSWNNEMAAANPLTVDITKLTFQHAGAGTATVTGAFLFDA